MLEEDIVLVQQSWAQILPKADTAMKVFYDRLFEANAHVARLFLGKDMVAQQSRLATAIDLVVHTLDQPEILVPDLRDLGARHVAYDVTESDFAAVGEALVSTLELGLADLWTNEHARAWAAAWEMICASVLTGYRRELAA